MSAPFLRVSGLLLIAGACGHNSGALPTAPIITGEVVLTANPNQYVPLTAVMSLQTSVPTQVELEVSCGKRSWHVVADPVWQTVHDRVPVVGLRPGCTHTIEVQVVDQQGNVTRAAAPLAFTTPPLPPLFPAIVAGTGEPAAMEPGWTLLSLSTMQPSSMPTIVDATGEVVWYFDCGRSPIGTMQALVQPLPNGHLMLIIGETLLAEIDLLGNVQQLFAASRHDQAIPDAVLVDVDTFHHDLAILPPGHDADYAVLSTELRQLPAYPTDVMNPALTEPLANVIGDVIVEFRRDGTVVRRIPLLDVLDPYRVSYDSLGNFWDEHYGVTTRDWSHANALAFDAAANAWLVSLRHQDAVVQVGRDGSLGWILGDHGRWQEPWRSHLLAPAAENLEWQYHQHAVQLLPDGSIHLFDNGCARAVAPASGLPAANRFSRAVQLKVDPVTRTVERLWSYGGAQDAGDAAFYSFFVSSAYRLPQTGNVLVCDGSRVDAGVMCPRITEVTGKGTPRSVFELTVADPTKGASWFCYRAYRLPDPMR